MKKDQIRIVEGKREEVVENVNQVLDSLIFNGCVIKNIKYKILNSVRYSVLIHYVDTKG